MGNLQPKDNSHHSDRVRLSVLGISYSQIQSGAYALILAQENGPYRIPVVVGAAEAQSIALQLEKVKPPRPLTHDLFASLAQAFGVRLIDVYIYKFEDGIFSSELTFEDATGRIVVLDARTSDAIGIALRTNSPIYTTRSIVAETGFIMEVKESGNVPESGDEIVESAPKVSNSPEDLSVEELENRLKDYIRQERYEDAAEIQAVLKKKRENGKQQDASSDLSGNEGEDDAADAGTEDFFK